MSGKYQAIIMYEEGKFNLTREEILQIQENKFSYQKHSESTNF